MGKMKSLLSGYGIGGQESLKETRNPPPKRSELTVQRTFTIAKDQSDSIDAELRSIETAEGRHIKKINISVVVEAAIAHFFTLEADQRRECIKGHERTGKRVNGGLNV